MAGLFREEVLQSTEHAVRFSFSVATGIFIGISPFWGWHTLLAVGAAVFFRLNKLVTVAASYISIPPLIPLILFLSYRLGGLILANKWEGLETDEITLEFVRENVVQYIVGAFALAGSSGFLGGMIAYTSVIITRKSKGRKKGKTFRSDGQDD